VEPIEPVGEPVATQVYGPGEAPGPMSSRRYLQLVLVLGALIALGPLSIDMYLPALPSLGADLRASESAVQATITGMLIGLGVGQLVIGPLSDAIGRRRPLIIGVAAHLVASVLCALAPSVAMLTGARVLQGLAGAAVSVVSMAIVRDLFSGLAAAQLLSRLMLVMGIAPILAPSLGGFVLASTTWRGIFVVLAVTAFLLVWVAVLGLRETLPVERRRPARSAKVLRTYGTLLRDREFMALVLIGGLVFATLFAYISGSSFVLQNVYGLSASTFAVVFGANAFGLVLATQANPPLVRRFGPRRVLQGAVVMAGPLWFIIAACGFSFPNTPALALTRHGEAAGTAAALLGSAQFVVGGIAAPLVGAFGSGSALPMAAVMAVTTVVAATLALVAVHGSTAPEALSKATAVDLGAAPVTDVTFARSERLAGPAA
jgi:DHA1 family bicyclomycin/chloramphenicol resistance-like MFS transporter